MGSPKAWRKQLQCREEGDGAGVYQAGVKATSQHLSGVTEAARGVCSEALWL